MNKRILLGITPGDLNGVGPELILKTFSDNRLLNYVTPIIYCSGKTLSFYRKTLNINDFSYQTILNPSEAKVGKVNVIHTWNEELSLTPGQPNSALSTYTQMALEAATNAAIDGSIDAMVTLPINKQVMQSENFNFPGHTEYLEHKVRNGKSLMLLITNALRIGITTGHIPLSEVAKQLSVENIVAKIKQIQLTLQQDFTIRAPKIAVLGLNPHAGDNGLLGKEEEQLIVPAIKRTNEEGILAFGPYSADGFFGSGSFSKFDAVLAMYHDQGLAPFKALAFHAGVNFTAGLPIIRTSPDHGTAYDIAGKGTASNASFLEAIYAAIDIVKNRRMNQNLEENAIKIDQKLKQDLQKGGE